MEDRNQLLDTASEALQLAISEGVVSPRAVFGWDDNAVIAWYEKQMGYKPAEEDEIPF